MAQIQLVQQSWREVVPMADQAAQMFYDRLFQLDPSLMPLFNRTEIRSQGRKLMQTLGVAVKGLTNLHNLVPVLQDLGHRHTNYGVTEEMYDTVGEALLWTLEQAFGPKFTPDLREAWTEAFSLAATAMMQAAHDRIAIIAKLATIVGFIEPDVEGEFVKYCRRATKSDPSSTAEDYGVIGGYFTAGQSRRLRQAASASTYTCTGCGWDGVGRALVIVKNTVMCPTCGRPTISLRVAAQPTPSTHSSTRMRTVSTVTGSRSTPSLVPGTQNEPSTMLVTPPSTKPGSDVRDSATMPRTAPKFDDLKPGTEIGDYRIEAPIGEGGMGHVYRAEDMQLGRIVAIKFLGPEWLQSTSQIARFEREARVLARLEHPHIVQIYRLGRHDGWPFVVLQWVEGESLGGRIKNTRGRLPAKKIIEWLTQTAKGLAAAHAEGIIHRDVKPDNLLLTKDDVVKVADFGLAKQTDGDIKLSRPGMLLGTPAYAAPEQMGGRPIDARCDVYSLGITAYHMLTGELPFIGDTVIKVLLKHETHPLPNIHSRNPTAPQALVDLILRMTAKSPEHRPESMQDVLDTLTLIG